MAELVEATATLASTGWFRQAGFDRLASTGWLRQAGFDRLSQRATATLARWLSLSKPSGAAQGFFVLTKSSSDNERDPGDRQGLVWFLLIAHGA
ncbi:hypothetical protein [Candidatus Viridilinea mediisalina]|uniref:Uncharacterized protein n=1 Tax=Candidatus Viridilinea mediisalina TaxID=2024553 RepID=A0A2A6RG31_9CHLR|nr:hypothetical protein [Candidatus Viridilinea mediisalina]PDW01846.1 hypothetical protein CJ255_17065 [Candidatus Viridilinea mediisalina]